MSGSESAEFDTSKPSIARVYDALLGGKDNFPADHAVVEHLAETVPEVAEVAKVNRAMLGRGVRYLAGVAGIKQFLDLGAGLPTMENTHQVAGALQPEARVVYVDIDPIALAHGRTLVADEERTTVVAADMRAPAAVLADPDVQQTIDFAEPVAVLLVGILHHLHDDEDPAGIVDQYIAAVPAGSYVFITHFCDSGPEARELEKSFLQFLGTGRFRTEEEILGLFRGLDLVEPGLVYLPEWHPDGEVSSPLSIGQRLMVGGIARKV
ncbi:SAM-dependent methyltransferase [Nocardia altamirensis]|uniref:SAM-dependent methyltransferase n=1 Tax=Nocardia altamirensis TaxID=472158 RepID=UPI00084066D1|nr:SAM-dependent methyltransferase [Nocardia altamirensis]